MLKINIAAQARPVHTLIDDELFLMGQAILNPSQPGERIDGVVAGEVAVMAGAQLMDTLIEPAAQQPRHRRYSTEAYNRAAALAG